MSNETLTSALGEVRTSAPLILYLPHKWFSPSSWSWLYAIKKQPRIGTWTFMQEGENVRIFEDEVARDTEIARLEQLEIDGANA